MSVAEELARLNDLLYVNDPPRAEREWGGAGVIVTATRPSAADGGSSDVYVVTPWALQLSWVIDQLGKAFSGDGRIDYLSKHEFYGRLAQAANRYLATTPDPNHVDVRRAVLDEARVMYEEFEADESMPALQAKVIVAGVGGLPGETVGESLERQLNEFLADNPSIEIINSHMNTIQLNPDPRAASTSCEFVGTVQMIYTILYAE